MLRELLGCPEAVRPPARSGGQEGSGSSAPVAPLLHFGLCKVRQCSLSVSLHTRAALRTFPFTACVFLALAGVGLHGADGGGPPHPAAAAGRGGARIILSTSNSRFYYSQLSCCYASQLRALTGGGL